MVGLSLVPLAHRQAFLPGFARVIDTIGGQDFAASLGHFLRETFGSVYFAGFRVRRGESDLLAAGGVLHPDIASDHAHRYVNGMHWRHDPVMTFAGVDAPGTRLVRVDPTTIGDAVLRSQFYRPASMTDKLAVCARRGDSFFGLNMLHTLESGRFSDESIARAAEMAEVMISALARHASLNLHEPRGHPLASPAAIEGALERAPWGLTLRERQVCARILFGVSVAGIALDLGIREQSVTTYRKRAYLRLGIATRHELMRRYLARV